MKEAIGPIVRFPYVACNMVCADQTYYHSVLGVLVVLVLVLVLVLLLVFLMLTC